MAEPSTLAGRLRYPFHLVRRFFGSLLPVGPSAGDRVWAEAQLLDGERAVWDRLSPADRRHAAGVARRTEAELGERATRPVLAAALLHDCGKVVAGYGPVRRSMATVVGAVAGRETAVAWAAGEARGPKARIGQYLDHARLGAGQLADAGSDPLTVAWAGQHHLPADRWTVPPAIGHALKAADDD